MKRFFTVIILLLISLGVFSQTYNMPAQGYLEIHSDSVTLYDDGGPAGNYSTRVKSVVTIFPDTTGGYIYLSGPYSLENQYKSRLEFYSGDTNSTSQITSTKYNNGCLNIRSTGPITIRFFADTETPNSGFEFNLRVCNDRPIIDSVFNITDSTAEFGWGSQDSSTNWIFAYRKRYSSSISEIATDTNYIKLDSLEKGTRYYYSIYTECDTVSNECGRFSFPFSDYFTTTTDPPPPPLITNMNRTIYCDAIELSWTSIDTNIVWLSTIYNYAKGRTDSIISNSTNIRFDSLLSATSHTVTICPVDTTIKNYDCYSYSFIRTKCCCSVAKNLHAVDIQSNSATFSWDYDIDTSFTSYEWIVAHRDVYGSNNEWIYDTVYVNQIAINNLIPARTYNVRVHSSCDRLNSNCASSTISIITNITGLDNCLTFTNLRDTNFLPMYGYYDNPNMYRGLRDFGYQNIESRHTVHFDTTEFDPRTDSLLRTIPLGEEASVRLGNWLPGRGAESFTYAYDVDTNMFDLMYLRYAVVMEEPGHAFHEQPRFTLEILDEDLDIIDEECGFADFHASDTLGWNTVPNSIVIWKDWTLVGFDITPYHGERIYIRLTTRDCDEGGHFGYAYYHLKCGSKKLTSTKCGYVDSNTFIAPIGFNYQWFSSANPNAILSTDRIFDGVVDSTINYHCLVSSTENPNCNFMYTAYGGYRFPLAQMTYDYEWSDCEYTVDFINLSTISPDGFHPAGTDEICETTKWVFPDGDTISTTHARKTFSDTSEVKVRLISGIANDECISILDTVLQLTRPYDPLMISGETHLCQNDSSLLVPNYSLSEFYWSTGDTTSSITVAPQVSTGYTVEVIDSLGCYSFDSIYLDVFSRDTTEFIAEICDNEYYTLNGFNTNTPGLNVLNLTSQSGCDSTILLYLTVHPTFDSLITAEICHGDSYTENGFNESEEGLHTLVLPSIHTCDSTINLELTVNPIYYDTIFASICDKDKYIGYGFEEEDSGVYSQMLTTYKGCDSISSLHLTVNPIYDTIIEAEICRGERYLENGFNESEEGFYTQELLTVNSCDSIVNLNLVVNPTYEFDTIDVVICKSDPYTNHGLDIDSTGIYVAHLYTAKGCDSIYVVDIEVNPVYYDTIEANIYKGNVYRQFGFEEEETGIYTQELKTYLGCDSIIYLDLQVDNVMFPNVVTPNGDGINDVFKLHNLVEQNAFPENELIIFNRQGKIIYQKSNIKADRDFWDPQETNTPDGTYFYRFTGVRHDKKLDVVGTVDVMR